jgi:P-type Cu+ transporter
MAQAGPLPTHGGPLVAPVACLGCGKLVDPLRAGHVAIFHDQFFYFCAFSCRQDLLARQPQGPEPPASIQPLRATVRTSAPPPSFAHSPSVRPLPTRQRAVDASAEALSDRSAEPIPDFRDGAEDISVPRSDTSTLLLLSATVGGVLAVALTLVGSSSLVMTLRLVMACVGAALLIARAFIRRADPAEPHPGYTLVGVGAAALTAVWAGVARDSCASEAAMLTALIVVSTGTAAQLVEHARAEAAATLSHIREVLDVPARRVTATGYAITSGASLRPGEEILIDAGEMVPADVMISAGEATVLPWLDATTAAHKAPGDALVGGAKLMTGRVRATVAWTGLDRAWLRTSADPVRAAHVVAPVVRAARMAVEKGGLAAAALAALAAFVNNAHASAILLSAIAAHVGVASIATATIPALHVLRGVLDGLARGISYRSGHDWDRAAQTTVMVFCARGTLLLGEPQVAEIVELGNVSGDGLLALAAGAEVAASGPIALAVLRAARQRKLRADAVRSPTVAPGLGVTAVTSSGQPLCVGSRALMLREHISIASVEERLAQLEAHGRTVLLVAVGTKLVGMVALQDGLRPGARASIQHLLDAGIEPVLLSGDARETCDAIARSLDIDHVRPEVLPSERANEINRIAESGAVVAVVGRPATDESPLEASDVAVALDAAGSTLGDWAVVLAGDDVRDAAHAVVWARRMRHQARTALMVSVAPGIVSALAIAFGLLPVAYAPLAVLLGAVAAHLHAKAVQSPEHERALRP